MHFISTVLHQIQPLSSILVETAFEKCCLVIVDVLVTVHQTEHEVSEVKQQRLLQDSQSSI